MSTSLRRIVAGVATLDRSDPALVPAIRLAERTGAELHLVHVFDGGAAGVQDDAGAAELRARLEAEAGALSQRGRIRCVALAGHAGEALPVLAAELAADLLVLGRSRRGGAAAAVLGTTAQRVLRSSSVPVLQVQTAPGAGPWGRVLLATDLSTQSAHALGAGAQLARALAQPAEPRLRPLFVTVPSYQAMAAGIPDWSSGHAAAELAGFLAEVPALAGLPGAVRTGDAADEILMEAEEWRASLIVVGTHGRRGLPRLLLGSVAETLLRRAPVSVLAIPPAAAPRPIAVATAQPSPRPRPDLPPAEPAAAPAARRRAPARSAVPARAILAATDLSSASDHVLRSAAAVAAATGAALHVIHAFDFASPAYMGRRLDRVTFGDRIAAAEAALAEQVARTVPPEVMVAEQRVEIYAAHRAIAEYAADVAAELVVVGAHTHHGSHLGVLGSTTDRLVRTLDVPCLVVRTELAVPLHRVVVPLDLSDPARAALELGVRWAGALGACGGGLALPEAEVAVVHVVPRLFAVAEPPFDQAIVPPGVNPQVDAAVSAAGSPANVLVREEVRWNDHPAAEIVSFAWHGRADLMVLATHGDGPVRRALIGSTASSVLRRATCPVLLVPPAMWRRPAPGAASPRRSAEPRLASVPA